MNKITTDVDADATGEPEASAKPVNKKKVLTIVGIIVAVIVLGVGGTMGVRSFQRYEAVQAAKAKMAKAEKVAKNTDPGKLFKKLSKTEQDKLFYQAFLDYAKIIKNDVFQSQEYADSIYDELIYDDTEDKTSGHTWTATEIDGIKGGLDSYTDGLSTDDVPKDVKALIKDETQDVADKLFANIRKEYIKEFGK
jgi:autotransporter adhesin